MGLENPFLSLVLNNAPVALPSSLHIEASSLAARLLVARAAGDLDLIADIESDIGGFICHLAREVEWGEMDDAVLAFYNDHFSDLMRSH